MHANLRLICVGYLIYEPLQTAHKWQKLCTVVEVALSSSQAQMMLTNNRDLAHDLKVKFSPCLHRHSSCSECINVRLVCKHVLLLAPAFPTLMKHLTGLGEQVPIYISYFNG